MQTHHQDGTGIAAQSEAGVGGAEQFDHLIVNDLDDLLAGLNALHHLLAEGFCFDLLDEIPGHLEIDIRLQQRHAHFPQGPAHVVLRNFAQPAQIAKRVLKFLAQRIEHAPV